MFTHQPRALTHAALLTLSLLAAALPPRVAAQVGPPPAPTTKAAPSGTLDLNTATSDELERLPGIGPSRARAILELRAQLKRFARVEDLLRVKGIGRATFRRLRPLVRVDEVTRSGAH